tara:strand:+ start:2824 stop:3072 length:249 start_codon:yes stop_codon:yes gene_type:complete
MKQIKTKREILLGYILKKKGNRYLTEDDKWKIFCNKTKHFSTLESVKSVKLKSRAKTTIVVVYDVYEGSNAITKYERVERDL